MGGLWGVPTGGWNQFVLRAHVACRFLATSNHGETRPLLADIAAETCSNALCLDASVAVFTKANSSATLFADEVRTATSRPSPKESGCAR